MRTIKSAICLVALASATLASAARFDLWIDTSNSGSYILHNNNTNQYVETINCKVAYTFVLDQTYLGGIRLYDASRNLFVLLDVNSMKLWPAGATSWTTYKSGTFDERSMYQHEDASGALTGAIWKRDACIWEEYLGGTARPDFTFQQYNVTPGTVILRDPSRNMYAMLGAGAMYLHVGLPANGTEWNFFKKGYWDR